MLFSTQSVLQHYYIHDRSKEVRHRLEKELELQKDGCLSYTNKFLPLWLYLHLCQQTDLAELKIWLTGLFLKNLYDI